ncbi:MAG: ABC transporter permease [Eubacterium sp.]|nr:ABC transporter permease [Eubacterium sp.]
MFGRIVIKTFKSALRSPKYIFWTLAFPIALGSLFAFAFGSIYSNEKTKPIPVVIEVTDGAIEEYKVIQCFSNLDGDRMQDDLEEYGKEAAMAEAMGQPFHKESPVSKDVLDKIDDVKGFDDLKQLTVDDLPMDYISINPDDVKEDDLPFIELMNTLEYDDGTGMIDRISVSDHDEAEALLEAGDIAGIIKVDGLTDVSMEENGYGVNHSILSSVISQYRLQVGLTIDTINEDSDRLDESDEMMDEAISGLDFIEIKRMNAENSDPFVQYFYNLIAMVSMMGSVASLSVIVESQANQSSVGMRLDGSPVNKTLFELATIFTMAVIQVAVAIIALTFYIYVLKINFGGNLGVVYLTTIIASIMGVNLGYVVAHMGKFRYEIKEGILMAIILVGGFMSGLMYGDMKAIMEEHFPIFNRINPSAVITDAFYALNVFGIGPRYYRALTYMLIMSAVLLIIGMIFSRKTTYKSL